MNPLEALSSTEHLKSILESRHPQGRGSTARNVAAFSEPILALSAPGGMASATPADFALSAEQNLHTTSGRDTDLAVGGKLAMAIKDAWNVFVAESGIKLLAGKKDIQLRAHDGQIQTTANQGLNVMAIHGKLELLAKNGITLATPGAKLEIKGGNISIEATNCNAYCASLNLQAGASVDAALPQLPGNICIECMLRAAQRGAPFVAK